MGLNEQKIVTPIYAHETFAFKTIHCFPFSLYLELPWDSAAK